MQNEDTDKRKQWTYEQVEEQLRTSDELPYDEALNSDEIIEVSLEELYEDATDPNVDLAYEEIIDTQHTDGSTSNIQQAIEQGLVYTPPEDPPVLPGEGFENAMIAAGFAQSMEDSDPDVEVLPDRVDNNDEDLQDDIYEALRFNAETSHLDLTKIEVHVNNGMVYLYGTVFSDDDIAIVDYLIRDLNGVRDIENFLEVEGFDDDELDTDY